MPTIKRYPEDFRVEEAIDISHKKNDCVIFTLEKRNENTVGAIKKIAREMGISFQRFGYAGLKDKHAVTRQKVSVRGVEKDDLPAADLRNITISEVERGDEIQIGDHRGNRFEIVVRDVPSPLSDVSDVFPNFFGEQRLGGNEKVGREMVRGDYEAAVKTLVTREGMEEAVVNEEYELLLEQYPYTYERSVLKQLAHGKDYLQALKSVPAHILTLYVHAYQSYLFNELLTMRLKRMDLQDVAVGDIICTEKFERRAYAKVTSSNITRVRNGNYSSVLPIVGYKTRVYADTKSDLDLLLERENVSLEDFKMKKMPFLSVRRTYRKIVGEYEDLSWEHKDNALYCEFFLPKGEYATVFIEHLLEE